jgi:Transglutaminase-like superfamily
VRGVAAFDELGELHALYRWVKGHIRYTKDPVTKEKLYPPQELLKVRAGDCDDISMLLGALAIAIGYPARLITVSANAQSPEEFSHVYVEAEAPAGSGNWVPLDAARLDSEFGAEPPHYFRKRAWSLTDDSYVDLSGHKRPWPQFLSGYVGLGQDDGIDWGSIIDTSIQTGLKQAPSIIAAAEGTGPYSSFRTPYSPGYGIPPAGYASPVSTGLGLSMGGMMPLLLIGGLILLATRGRS